MKVLLPNFKAMGPTQTELHVLINVETLDAVISPLFTNLVTYMYI